MAANPDDYDRFNADLHVQMSAFGEEMQRLNITEKVLLRDGKRAIRAELNAAQQADAEPETDDHLQVNFFLMLLCSHVEPQCGF